MDYHFLIMDTLRSIESFVKAVESGSIAAGARQLGITPAAASQNIQRLEKSLDARLLHRSTRSLALTDAGLLYFNAVKSIVRQLELAKSSVTEYQGEPQGRLRVACSAAFGRHVIAALIPAFTRRYPRVSFELITTDESIDHIKEDIDISIRFRQQLELNMIARRIASIPLHFCASPDYLARAGRPDSPEALGQFDCLMFRMPSVGRLLNWPLVKDGLRFEPEITPVITSNDIDVLARLAAGGAGITRLSDFIAQPYLQSGQLESLFPPDSEAAGVAQSEPLEFYVTYHDRQAMTHKVRAFVDYLVDAIPAAWKHKPL